MVTRQEDDPIRLANHQYKSILAILKGGRHFCTIAKRRNIFSSYLVNFHNSSLCTFKHKKCRFR